MLLSPIASIINPYFINQWMFIELEEDRYRQPMGSFWRFNPVSIPPAMFVILDIIVNDKDIASVHLLKKAKPREITRLKDTNDHRASSLECLSLRP